MKNLIFTTLFITISLFSYAQDEMVFGASKVETKKEIVGLSSSEKRIYNATMMSDENPNLIYQPRKIGKDYTGFVIKIKMVEEDLPMSDKIFSEFGKVRMDYLENDQRIYLIGDFKKSIYAYEYLVKIVSQRYPSAGVLEYNNGKIVE